MSTIQSHAEAQAAWKIQRRSLGHLDVAKPGLGFMVLLVLFWCAVCPPVRVASTSTLWTFLAYLGDGALVQREHANC